MSDTRLLQSGECCLHIIDPQESLMRQIHEAERVTRVIRLMIECCRILDVPILANTQYVKGLGPYVEPLEKMMGDIPRRDKVEFSAYRNRETVNMIEGLSRDISTIILVGVETHICIYQSAVGVLEKGLIPWIIADGVSARSLDNHTLGLNRLRQMGAVIGPAEMIIYELLGKAGTPKFKEVLPHIIAFNKESE